MRTYAIYNSKDLWARCGCGYRIEGPDPDAIEKVMHAHIRDAHAYGLRRGPGGYAYGLRGGDETPSPTRVEKIRYRVAMRVHRLADWIKPTRWTA